MIHVHIFFWVVFAWMAFKTIAAAICIFSAPLFSNGKFVGKGTFVISTIEHALVLTWAIWAYRTVM